MDEIGNVYEATYPKRARGLVKNGRARFINEHTICLACPPSITEDIKMTENGTKYTVDYILDRLEDIRSGRVDFEKIPQPHSELACEREKTDRALIELYSRMYDDLTATPEKLRATSEARRWSFAERYAETAAIADDFAEARSDALTELRQILRENK